MFRIADIGGALKKHGDIEYGRLRNEALGMEIEEAENMLKNRTRAREIRAQFEQVPDQVRELNAAGLYDQADELAKGHVEMFQAKLNLAQDFTDDLNAENYDMKKQQALNEGIVEPGEWPDTYSAAYFHKFNAKQAAALTKLTRKWEEEGVIMSQDLLQQGGQITWEGEAYADPDDLPKSGAGADNWKGWSASDTNTLSRVSERMFGTFDPVSGDYAILDRDMAQQVASLQTMAEQYYVKGRNRGDSEMTHMKALALAAKDAGIDIPNPMGRAQNDPAGLDNTEAGRRRQQQN
jgi:hypothetical protein